MEWQLARDYRPQTPERRPLNLRRWSMLALSLGWLLPILVLCWQASGHCNDGYFQEAAHHSTSWLVDRVGEPDRVMRYNGAYRLWFYGRGSCQIKVAVNQRNQVCGVDYSGSQ